MSVYLQNTKAANIRPTVLLMDNSHKSSTNKTFFKVSWNVLVSVLGGLFQKFKQGQHVRTWTAVSEVHTLCIKKWGTYIICLPHNSYKYEPVLIILSLSHSQMNCRKRLNKIYHLTSSLLPHYCAKVECSTLLLYSTLFNANGTQNRLFTALVYRRC